jgi:predicted DCC family thiol-disulfide oxidoreductase YuxK
MSSTIVNASPRGWVLYDGSCGICARWVPFWIPTLRKRGFEVAPLQTAWVRERLALSEDSLLEDVRLLLADGSQVRGAEVYRFFLKRIWWAYPIFLLSLIPGLRQMFNWSYRTFAKNRFRFSKACGVQNDTKLVNQKP